MKSPLQEEVNDCFSNFQRSNFLSWAYLSQRIQHIEKIKHAERRDAPEANQRPNYQRREACKSKGSTIEMKKVAWEGWAIRAEAVKS